MKINRYEVYHDTDGWRWRLVAEENGEVLASGQAYTDRADVVTLIDRISDGGTQRKVVFLEGTPTAKRTDARPYRLEHWSERYGTKRWSWVGNYRTKEAAHAILSDSFYARRGPKFRIVDTKTRAVIEEWTR